MSSPKNIWRAWFKEVMSPYGGQILTEVKDQYGYIRVVKVGSFHAMYFDSTSCQGRIDLDSPTTPSSEYIRSVLYSTLCLSKVERILLLGLGPGALVHPLLKVHPSAEIHIVELRSEVLRLAQLYFELPNGPRCHYYAQDATNFLKKNKEIQFDIIIVDMALSHGVSPLLLQPGFWTLISENLTDESALIANLWKGTEHNYPFINKQVRQLSVDRVWSIEHQSLDNIVICGIQGKYTAKDYLRMYRGMIELAKTLHHSALYYIQQVAELKVLHEHQEKERLRKAKLVEVLETLESIELPQVELVDPYEQPDEEPANDTNESLETISVIWDDDSTKI